MEGFRRGRRRYYYEGEIERQSLRRIWEGGMGKVRSEGEGYWGMKGRKRKGYRKWGRSLGKGGRRSSGMEGSCN